MCAGVKSAHSMHLLEVSPAHIASLHHSSVWIIANLDSDIVHVDMEQQVQSSKH